MKNILKKALTVLLCVSMMCFLPGCSDSGEASTPKSSSAEKTDYTVEIRTNGGLALKDVGVYVYTDTTLSDLVWAGTTDEKGSASFSAEQSEQYAFVLREVSADFAAEDYYLLDRNSVLVALEPVIADTSDLNRIYQLGDIMQNYTFKAANGNEYKISELLKTKKAVVLNLWFENCGPCKMEFPYMQQAYEDFKSDIEILALNPVDGTDGSITEFANRLGLTFPMAAVEPEWESCMKITAYPTTVIIDRYGMITMIHKGSITDKETFVKIFEYFTADGYQQTLIEDLSDIK